MAKAIKAKPWSHISSRRSEFMVLGLQSLILGHWFCFVDLESQFLGPESWFLVSRSWIVRYWSQIYSVIIREYDKKLLISFKKSGNYCKVRAGKIRRTVVSCAYRVPEVVLRRTKYRVPKIFISSYLYLRCKFRSSAVTDKQ